MIQDQQMSRVGIFGGSFNPPHIGHSKICRHVLDHHKCDQIWVMPCLRHPFDKDLAPFPDRIAMCKFAFAEFREKVFVSDIEKRLGGVSHTVKTLLYLKEQMPNKIFLLVLGSDTAKETAEWKDFERIEELVKIVTVPRGPDSPITDISSTEIRKKVKAGEDFSRFVILPVAIYIKTHGLYQD